ncbi:MAG: protoporphyrinogen oxidase [Ignavibacteria bacterium]|jgi:oxygen-dependent protoporphyrinogen oxidase
MDKNKVIVIGGGISGLATAFWLDRKGVDVKLFEKEARVGGTIKSEMVDGYLIEHGPSSALDTTPLIDKLLVDLEIKEEKLSATDEAKKRYILRNGKLFPLPMNPFAFMTTKLFSRSAKLRLFKEPFIKTRSNRNESIAEFTERRLGREFLDYAINPFVAGVFAGDPDNINVKTAFPKLYDLEKEYGGLINGAVRSAWKRKRSKEVSKQSARTFSFKEGMQTLPLIIYERIKDKIEMNTEVLAVEKTNEKKYKVKYKLNGQVRSEYADAIVISLPSLQASKLLSPFDEKLSCELKQIYYPPVNVVFMGFRKKEVNYKLDGFGYLIPAKENRKILGSLWNSCIFPNRAPDGSYAMTTYIGGARQPEMTEKDDDETIELTLKELDSVIGLKSKPDIEKIIRWDRAIPQYNNHYADITDSIEKFMNDNKGIYICCNYYKGISVGDCIKNADATVNSVLNYLRTLD